MTSIEVDDLHLLTNSFGIDVNKVICSVCNDLLLSCENEQFDPKSAFAFNKKLKFLNSLLLLLKSRENHLTQEKLSSLLNMLLNSLHKLHLDSLEPVISIFENCLQLSNTKSICSNIVDFYQSFFSDLKLKIPNQIQDVPSNFTTCVLLENLLKVLPAKKVMSLIPTITDIIIIQTETVYAQTQKRLEMLLSTAITLLIAIGKHDVFIKEQLVHIFQQLCKTYKFLTDSMLNEKTLSHKHSLLTKVIFNLVNTLQMMFNTISDGLIGSVLQERPDLLAVVNHILNNNFTWCTMQGGIYNTETITRKNTVKLLKSLVGFAKNHSLFISCYSASETLTVHHKHSQVRQMEFAFKSVSCFLNWKSYISICETLEENQSHFIKPALVKLKSIFCTNTKDKKDVFQVPYSWLLVLMMRMFSHANKQVQKEAVIFCCQLDIQICPFVNENTFATFLCQGLLPTLQNEQLYYHFPESSNPMNVPNLLLKFVKASISFSPIKETLMQLMLTTIHHSSWSPVSLLYVSNAIANVTPFPCWGVNELHTVRYLLTHTVKTYKKTLKLTIQNIFLHSFVQFADVKTIKLYKILNFLSGLIKQTILQRKSKVWNVICLWFVENLDSMAGQQFSVQNVCLLFKELLLFDKHQPILNHADVENQTHSVATLLFLYSDGMALSEGNVKSVLLDSILNPIGEVLDKAASHPYITHQQIFFSFSLINSIINVSNVREMQSWSDQDLVKSLLEVWPGLTEYVTRNMMTIFDSIESLKYFTDVIDNFLEIAKASSHLQFKLKINSSCLKLFYFLINTSQKVISRCKNKLGPTIIQEFLISLYILEWSCCRLCKLDLEVDNKTTNLKGFFQDMKHLYTEFMYIKFESNSKGKYFKEQFLFLWWSIIRHSTNPCFNLHYPIKDLYLYTTMLNDCISITNVAHLSNLYATGSAIFDLILSPGMYHLDNVIEESCSSCVISMWKTTLDLQGSSSFPIVYRSFVKAVFRKNVVDAHAASINNAVVAAMMEIQNMAQQRSNLLHDVLTSLVSIVASSNAVPSAANDFTSDQKFESKAVFPMVHCSPYTNHLIKENSRPSDLLNNYLNFLIFCATYARTTSKDILSLDQAMGYILLMKPGFQPTETEKMHGVESNIISSSLLHYLSFYDKKFAKACSDELLLMSKALFQKSPRCHVNSSNHLVNQKIWQNLLLILPFLSDNQVKEITNEVTSMLNHDAQASVRHLMEWYLTLLLLRNPSPAPVQPIFDILQHNKAKEVSFSMICSCLVVGLLYGLGKQCVSDNQFQDKYFINLVSMTIPWCMTQHFSVRLYGHAVILRIFRIFEDKGQLSHLKDIFPFIETCISFADHSSGNVLKNWLRIKENAFIFYFDPINDFSVETIFRSVPRLCQLTFPDFDILSEIFSNLSRIPVRNVNSMLRELPASSWLPMTSNKNHFEKQFEPTLLNDILFESNLQKKVVVTCQNKKADCGLILVASLIDKTSNLGGLTRTCEIFGAELLVVHSLTCTEDKLYQSLSVTAHKWQPITEVKRWDLEKYLTAKKTQNYTLIGTEQTEQSKCLSQYSFPRKCVVLLGNEKEGIPTALLRLLDVCLEIPQLGVVRSLNVHVSGAVTMWEHAKQTRFKNLEYEK